MKPFDLDLHIDELVLHGFEFCDGFEVRQAMQNELQRLFLNEGISPNVAEAGQIDLLNAGAFEVPANSSARTVGFQIAQNLYGSLQV
ncbi:MAG: hypothetical protein ACE5HS_07885 [bacterium]